MTRNEYIATTSAHLFRDDLMATPAQAIEQAIALADALESAQCAPWHTFNTNVVNVRAPYTRGACRVEHCTCGGQGSGAT